jgi:hypothetical protein
VFTNENVLTVYIVYVHDLKFISSYSVEWPIEAAVYESTFTAEHIFGIVFRRKKTEVHAKLQKTSYKLSHENAHVGPQIFDIIETHSSSEKTEKDDEKECES